jgi:hypothetical protein
MHGWRVCSSVLSEWADAGDCKTAKSAEKMIPQQSCRIDKILLVPIPGAFFITFFGKKIP